MSDRHDLLNRFVPFFPAPEQPFEGFLRRRDRKRRDRRIAAGALGVAVGLAAILIGSSITRQHPSVPANPIPTPSVSNDLAPLLHEGEVLVPGNARFQALDPRTGAHRKLLPRACEPNEPCHVVLVPLRDVGRRAVARLRAPDVHLRRAVRSESRRLGHERARRTTAADAGMRRPTGHLPPASVGLVAARRHARGRTTTAPAHGCSRSTRSAEIERRSRARTSTSPPSPGRSTGRASPTRQRGSDPSTSEAASLPSWWTPWGMSTASRGRRTGRSSCSTIPSPADIGSSSSMRTARIRESSSIRTNRPCRARRRHGRRMGRASPTSRRTTPSRSGSSGQTAQTRPACSTQDAVPATRRVVPSGRPTAAGSRSRSSIPSPSAGSS